MEKQLTFNKDPKGYYQLSSYQRAMPQSRFAEPQVRL